MTLGRGFADWVPTSGAYLRFWQRKEMAGECWRGGLLDATASLVGGILENCPFYITDKPRKSAEAG